MVDAKYSTVRLSVDGDKFEILVKPDPALEYKTGKRTDFSSILISEEIYSDANKGSESRQRKVDKTFQDKRYKRNCKGDPFSRRVGSYYRPASENGRREKEANCTIYQ